MRCKFVCEKNEPNADNGSQLVFRAVTSGSQENEEFFKYTPCGQLTLGVVNENAAKEAVEGQEYYVDITPVVVSEPQKTGLHGLTEGRIVHYVLPDGPSAGQHRPAIVVKNWGGGGVQLQVFTDGQNDGAENVVWVTSILHSETKEKNTWHWIERA